MRNVHLSAINASHTIRIGYDACARAVTEAKRDPVHTATAAKCYFDGETAVFCYTSIQGYWLTVSYILKVRGKKATLKTILNLSKNLRTV